MTSKTIIYLAFIVFFTASFSSAFDLKGLGDTLKDTLKSSDKKKDKPSSPEEASGNKVKNNQQANDDSIQPFGTMLWTDSFVEVINKLNALEIDSLVLSSTRRFQRSSYKGFFRQKHTLAKINQECGQYRFI